MNRLGGTWLLLGDLNSVLDRIEKINWNRVRDNEMVDLRAFVDKVGLTDVPASACYFTWSNCHRNTQERIWCKLDRAMGNEDWFKEFEDSYAIFQPPSLSDHSPVVVAWGEPRKAIRSQPNLFSEALDQYKDEVNRCWGLSEKCKNLSMVQAKLKRMKGMMKVVFGKETRGLDGRVNNARDALLKVQQEVESSPENVDLVEEERARATKYKKLMRIQLIFYKQQAKIRWASEGDANTKFFHSFVKSRREKNKIRVVQTKEGLLSTDQSVIKEEFVSHFKGLLSHQSSTCQVESEIIESGPVLDVNQCRRLVMVVTNKEIWNAISNIGSDKAPGPDGFSSGFFKKNWSLIGKEVCSSVRHCLRNNALPGGMNSAYIDWFLRSNLQSNPRILDLFRVAISCVKWSQQCWQQGLGSSGRNCSVMALKTAVDKFLATSGLSINLGKSQVFVAGVKEVKKDWLEDILTTKLHPLPVKYLGIPLSTKRLRSSEC
ncbi:hypothetical protein QQ045_020843 [Rhodiola kirilowii]